MYPLIVKTWFLFNLTVSNVYLWINVNEIKYPKVVLRQAVIETGWFKCTNCSLDYNNIFGMYSDHYLRDTSFIHSIERYKKWQLRYMPDSLICNEEEYYQWLIDYRYACDSVCSYDHAKNYVNTLKQIRLTYNPK